MDASALSSGNESFNKMTLQYAKHIPSLLTIIEAAPVAASLV